MYLKHVQGLTKFGHSCLWSTSHNLVPAVSQRFSSQKFVQSELVLLERHKISAGGPQKVTKPGVCCPYPKYVLELPLAPRHMPKTPHQRVNWLTKPLHLAPSDGEQQWLYSPVPPI